MRSKRVPDQVRGGQNFKTEKRWAGFTLMELLVVVAIIGIISSVAAISYTAIQKKSRDNRRLSDIKAIQNAFEQYYGDNNNLYPSVCAGLVATTTYLPAGYPTDPKTDVAYAPTACSSTGYCVCATLESSTTGGNALDTNCNPGSGPYYCAWDVQ